MDRMADTVVKDRDAAERALEKRILAQWMEKEDNDKHEDERRKQALRIKEQEMREALKMQLHQKNLHNKMEKTNNAIYMQEWVERGEEDRRRMEREEKEHRGRKVENAMFLKEQMGTNNLKQGNIKQAAVSKTQVRGAMNEEEIRLNKGLLKEISLKKKHLKASQM